MLGKIKSWIKQKKREREYYKKLEKKYFEEEYKRLLKEKARTRAKQKARRKVRGLSGVISDVLKTTQNVSRSFDVFGVSSPRRRRRKRR